MAKIKTQPMKRPGKLDALSVAVAADYAHQNSAVISSRMRVLQCEADETDRSIIALSASLANARDRRAKIAATIRGLSSVIEKR